MHNHGPGTVSCNRSAMPNIVHRVNGGCHCGNVRVELDLTREPGKYNPRTCDCDYCRKHGASYVSDANGSLVIRMKDEGDVGRYRQGGGLAEFLFCRSCGVLVGSLYRRDGRIYAAVNVNATDSPESFDAEFIVSPKKLSGSEKAQRWQEIWFSDVEIVGGGKDGAGGVGIGVKD